MNLNKKPQSEELKPTLEHMLVNHDDNAKHGHDLQRVGIEQADRHHNEVVPLMENSLEKLGDIHAEMKNKPDVQKVSIVSNDENELAKAFWGMLRGPKGEKGDSIKGDKGDEPSDERLVSLIKPLILPSMKGEKGDSVVGPQGKMGPKPVAGIDYPIPKNGKDGKPGKDAKPVTKEELVKIIIPLIPKAIKGDPGKDAVIDHDLLAEKIAGMIEYSKIKNAPQFPKIAGTGYLREITDVDTTGLQVGHSLKWDGKKWVVFTPTSGFQLMTTAQRLALSATSGQTIYDTDLNSPMIYVAGNWYSLQLAQ